MFSSQASRRSAEAPNPNLPGGVSAAGMRNRVYTNNHATNPLAINAASNIIIVAMRAKALSSGIFWADFNLAYTTPAALVSADTYAFTVVTQTDPTAAAITYTTPANMTTIATFTGVGGIDVVANAAGTTIATGGGGALIQYAATYKSNVAATGTGKISFVWGDVIDNSLTHAAGSTPFTKGANVIVTLLCNMSANPAASFDSLSCSMYELP